MKKKVLALLLALSMTSGVMALPMDMTVVSAEETGENTPAQPTQPVAEPVPSTTPNLPVQAPSIAPDAGTTGTYEEFDYTVLSNGTVEITRWNDEVDKETVVELVIPSEINGKAVTSIGNHAFQRCESLQSIELPEGLTSIGDSAFDGCESLQSIELPEGITSIASRVFCYCDSLENITISGTLAKIEESAFYHCASLTGVYYSGTMEQWRTLEKAEENQRLDYANIYCSDDTVEAKEFGYTVLEDGTIEINQAKSVEELVIPSELDGKRVTRVGENAFCHCKILKKVTIPDSVTSIESDAFYDCSNLSEITVPDTLTDIGGGAFAETAWMEAQRAKNPLVILNGVLIDGCAASGEVTVPDSVSVIGSFAFGNCENLTGILLPDSVTSIEYYAFSRCNSLKNITFSDSITSIAAEAFRECTSLKNITIPDSVESIGEWAFVICSDLEYVTIPDSVTNLDKSAFANCFNLKEVYYSGTKTQWSAMSIADTDSSLVHTDIHCKDGIIAGREYAYRVLEDGTLEFISYKDKNAIEIEVPAEIDGKTVTKIADYAFHRYSALKSLKIPDTITVIGGWILGFNEIDTIYYSGTEEQWKAIEFGYWNGVLHGDVQYNAYVPGTGNNTEQTNPDNTNNPAPIALSKITLSKSEAVYNGKAQTPAVTVVDANGQPVDAANYTVTYSNNQNVGQATVSVTGKNTYTGTVTATFNIIPKGTTISKVTAKKKAFTVKWKKQAKETTGYEVQYSTSKKFKDAKTTTVKKSKTTSATVKKLKAKKKYYVRIRTYKTVKINGKSTKLYSDWSKAKTTKVK